MNMQTIIAKLEADLNEVVADEKLAAVYPYPKDKIDVSPAAVFYPISVTNAYHSTKDNSKEYSFIVAVVYKLRQDSDNDKQEAYTVIMPQTIDAIIQKLDEKWYAGAVDGRILWMTMQAGDWVFADTKSGPTLTAFMTLSYNIINNIN